MAAATESAAAVAAVLAEVGTIPMVLSFQEDSSMFRMTFSRGSLEVDGLLVSLSSRPQLSSSLLSGDVEERSVVVGMDEVEREG